MGGNFRCEKAPKGLVIYSFSKRLMIWINDKKTHIKLDIVNAIDIYKVFAISGLTKHIIPEKKVKTNSTNIIK